MPHLPSLEPLEPRIAPALILQNPLLDLAVGGGTSRASIDLSKMFDAAATQRTHVKIITNVDTDAATAGLQAGIIELELYDDLAPLTVQNFLGYVNNPKADGDYDNTYFHRAGEGFVLQGGGFDASKFGTHIPVGFTVPNEPDINARSNVRGTVAMAKVSGDPNSATSEWFINIGDNASNLDNQNGGFTVFGRVVSGLELADQIVALPKINVSGGTGTPVQNYSGTATPTLDQLIRITDVEVVKGNAADITYTATVTPLAGASAGIVKAAVKGATLDLAFSGASGQADIAVTGKNAANETTTDTFRLTLAPNLLAQAVTTNTQEIVVVGTQGRPNQLVLFPDDGFETLLVPGDRGTIKTTVANSGSANFFGPVKVEFFLSQTRLAGDADGTVLDDGDRLLHTIPSQNLSLAPGKTTTLTATFSIPPELVGSEDFSYRILTRVTPLGGSSQLNGHTSDDIARLSAQHGVFNRAGDFNASFTLGENNVFQFDEAPGTSVFTSRDKTAVLQYVQDDGNPATNDPLVTVTLKGPGVVAVNPAAGGGFDFSGVQTTGATKIAATTGKGQPRVEFRGIALDSPIGVVDFGGVNLNGFASFAGGVQTLKLGDIPGPGGLSIGAFLPSNTTRATISLGRVADASFESSQPVASLTAFEWLDTGGPSESLLFHGLDKLAITGAKGGTRGDLMAFVENASETPITSITVAGVLKDSVILASGDIKSVTLGAMDHSSVFAGAFARPETLADFLAERTIGKFTIKGVTGLTDFFIASDVAAHELGAVSVQKVATANASAEFGFVADAIKSYNRTGGARLSKLEAPGTFDTAGDYLVRVL